MTNESILGIFAKSPFVSLQKHMDIGKQTAIALQNFLTSAGQFPEKTCWIWFTPWTEYQIQPKIFQES